MVKLSSPGTWTSSARPTTGRSGARESYAVKFLLVLSRESYAVKLLLVLFLTVKLLVSPFWGIFYSSHHLLSPSFQRW